MAEVLPRFKQDLAEIVLVPAGGGRFELSLDGDLFYSKLETGQFPDPAAVIAEIERRLGV
jgi:selenoprotein W-related protein